MSAFLAGVLCGTAGVVAVIAAATGYVHRHAKMVDRFFNEQLDPVPSNVRVLDAQRRGVSS